MRHEGRSQEIAERAVAEAGLVRHVALHTPHYVSLPFHIASSDLISIVPRNLATSFEKVMDLQIAAPPIAIPDIPLKQHWAKRSATDPAVAWLTSLVEELFLGRDPT
ncbi:hypothetical protein GRI99_15315 [Altererythrobacter buctensis]|uniref:LysR substrate-binding domain-containing protein n=1 Tax=Alteraurantiacibacter buctensis TaxID=1503981 RepID=A0A844Z0X4_9SPHN|nr:hypothetical protein [Alteraurantiacibacter buctensis]MXO72998.1 hypothetical protein [Alteraurantiacibacter buctensis]